MLRFQAVTPDDRRPASARLGPPRAVSAAVPRDPLRSGDADRAELNADPRADRPGRLGDGVLPGALARTAHHDEVAVAERELQRLVATGAGPQHEVARRAERDDGDHGVDVRRAADRVAVPGD